ncbi:hypothetical protein CRE_29352 [Caenorhabditis remanei]|uniref:Uncharacterized protein n=1 Tax=Caenorhabditis remanei TaxID=31234 RepID=E3MY14_CAERE|nr:hypothetical protein CRE_29352 [Caenorhabditis remanei]
MLIIYSQFILFLAQFVSSSPPPATCETYLHTVSANALHMMKETAIRFLKQKPEATSRSDASSVWRNTSVTPADDTGQQMLEVTDYTRVQNAREVSAHIPIHQITDDLQPSPATTATAAADTTEVFADNDHNNQSVSIR